jgi:hypothetical protein
MAGLRHVVETARRAATPVHVFALVADMDYYVRQLADERVHDVYRRTPATRPK